MSEQENGLPFLNLDFQNQYKEPNCQEQLLGEFQRENSQITKLSQQKFKRWADKEQLQYFLFVHHHFEKLKEKNSRLPFRIFKIMSKFISSRSCDQCRSHHQKMARIGTSLQHKLNLFKEKNINFIQEYEKVKDKLTQQEDADFYLDCGSSCTENYNKNIFENKDVAEEKLSPATAIDETEKAQKVQKVQKVISKNSPTLNRLDYLSKVQALILYYQKWKTLAEELIESEENQQKDVHKEQKQNPQDEKMQVSDEDIEKN